MSTVKQIIFASLLISALLTTAAAQQDSATAQRSSLTITAAAAGERVRIAAPSSIVQMHVEVYAASGEKLFDQEIRGGNVFDWHLQDGQAQRLAPGSYVCVVTAKSISGKLTQKVGTVKVAETSVVVQPAESLSAPQAQTIGPVEENSSWTIPGKDEPQTPTVIANDGTDGQMIRGRGALTFRIGNFFTGIDTEQMRLTEDGNLGIGTTKPKVKLDVAGTIRAREGFQFSDGSTLKINEKGVLTRTNADGTAPSAVTTTQNRLAKFTDNAGTLGDTSVSESNGAVVIGTAQQSGNLQIFGNATADVFAGMGPDLINGPAFNYGYAGNSFGRSAGFFNVRPDSSAIAPNPSLRFATANVQRMIIDNNGNVGIGTNAPTEKLNVVGNGLFTGNLTSSIINTTTQYNISGNRILSAAGSNNLFAGVNAGSANTGSQNAFFGRDAGIANTSGINNNFFGFEAGLSHMTNGNNSFFGSFAGESDASGSNNSFFGEGAGSAQTSGAGNSFFGFHAGNTNIDGSNNTTIGSDADVGSGSLSFATAIGAGTVVSTSNTIALGRSNGSDRVGIGTAAPAKHLHIFGAGDQELAIESSDTNGRQWTMQSARGTSNGRFEIIDRTAAESRLSILDSGNVGIGTTGPAAKLHIVDNGGHILFGGVGCNSGFTGITFGTTQADCTNYSLLGDGNKTFINAPSVISFGINNSEKMSLDGIGDLTVTKSVGAGNFSFTSNLNEGNSVLCYSPAFGGSFRIDGCGSSVRLKKNISSFTAGLDLINRLRPVSFDWKSNGKRDLGLIAEEVDSVEPLLVTRNDKGEAAGVKYEKLPVVLINAIKEQQSQIEQQQSQIQQQQAQIKSQELSIQQHQIQAKQQGVQLAQQRAEILRQEAGIDALSRLVCASHPRAAVCKRRQVSKSIR